MNICFPQCKGRLISLLIVKVDKQCRQGIAKRDIGIIRNRCQLQIIPCLIFIYKSVFLAVWWTVSSITMYIWKKCGDVICEMPIHFLLDNSCTCATIIFRASWFFNLCLWGKEDWFHLFILIICHTFSIFLKLSIISKLF